MKQMSWVIATLMLFAHSGQVLSQAVSPTGACVSGILPIYPDFKNATVRAVYRQSTPVLQIFPNLTFPCAGYIASWSFISLVPTIYGLHLSVWRNTTTSQMTTQQLTKISDIRIDGQQASVQQVNIIPVQQSGQQQVLAGDMIGIYYDNGSTAEVIPYADFDTAQPGDSLLISLTPTWVAILFAPDIQANPNVQLQTVAVTSRMPAIKVLFTTTAGPAPSPVPYVPPTPIPYIAPTPPMPSPSIPPTQPQMPYPTATPSMPSGGQSPYCNVPVQNNVDKGNCTGQHMTRYYFNPRASLCMSFYGCSRSTGNNWASMAACQKACIHVGGPAPYSPPPSSPPPYSPPPYSPPPYSPPSYSPPPYSPPPYAPPPYSPPPYSPPSNNRCSNLPVRGVDYRTCANQQSANSIRYYFNPQSGMCSGFMGCDTGDVGNNFPTKQECMSTCQSMPS